MKRKILVLLCLLLCVLCPLTALAQTKPECRIEGHYKGDGLNHKRPQSCWVTGHNYCDGMDHDRAACGKWGHFNCDGREHEAASCGAQGHNLCDKLAHQTPACGAAGHCVSDGARHTAAACGVAGHYKCDGMKHAAAACGSAGHMGCDGLDHTRAACGASGHMNCDGNDHEKGDCGRYGHCVLDGANHGAAPCGHAGHYICDGRNHELAACGVADHYACEVRAHQHKPISKYCDAVPQHMICEGDQPHYCDPAQGGCGDTYLCSNSNAHTACRMCGLLWCDRTLGSHETPCEKANHRPCVYRLNGRKYIRDEHDWCGYCGRPRCENDGEHGNGKCVDSCPKCGGPEKMDKSHKLPCRKHYGCQTKGDEHKKTCDTCGKYYCAHPDGAACIVQ